MISSFVLIACSFEWLLLIFHLTVVLFVVHSAARKRKPFTSAFFTIFLVQSIVDVLNYLLGSVLLRLTQTKLLPDAIVYFSAFPKAFMFASGYCSFFECFSHTLIAVNRYTVISDPTAGLKIWSGKSFHVVIAAQFFIPFLFSSVRLMDDPVVIDARDSYALKYASNWVGVCAGLASVLVTVLTCIVSCCLELRTLHVYKRLSQRMRRERREDYRLLLYALLGLVSQTLLAVYYGLSSSVVLTYPSVVARLQPLFPYLIDLLSLTGSACLFITSKTLRKGYFEFYGLERLRSHRVARLSSSS